MCRYTTALQHLHNVGFTLAGALCLIIASLEFELAVIRGFGGVGFANAVLGCGFFGMGFFALLRTRRNANTKES